MAPYSTKPEIQDMFSTLSTGGDFFAHVHDDVNWQIMGHSPMNRAYANKTEFQAVTLKYLADKVLTEPLKMCVVNVVGGGGEDTAAVEMKADAVCRNGE
jgi:ketosteroid isomerase-like protein